MTTVIDDDGNQYHSLPGIPGAWDVGPHAVQRTQPYRGYDVVVHHVWRQGVHGYGWRVEGVRQWAGNARDFEAASQAAHDWIDGVTA